MTAKSNSLTPKASDAPTSTKEVAKKKEATKKRAGRKRTAKRRADKVIDQIQPVLCGIGESKKAAICEELRKIVESL